MSDRTLTLGVQTDEATIANAKKRLSELEAAQKRLAAAQLKYANDSSKAGKAINEGITKQSKELEKEQKRLQRALEQTNKAFIDQQSAAGRAAKGVEAAKAASTAGRSAIPEPKVPKVLTSADRLRQVGRDIRGLPSVQVPGLGVGTDTFGRAAEVLGRVGVGMKELAIGAGVTTVALGAVAVAFHLAAEAAREQAKVLNSVIEANRKVGQDIAQGLTTEQAEKRIAELQRFAAEEQKVLNENTAARENSLNALSKATNIARDEQGLADALAGLAPQVGTLNTQIDTSKAAIEGYETEINSLKAGMEDGTLAANDAAAAEKALNDARTAAALLEADEAGTLAELKARAADLTQEQIDGELKALEIRKAGLEAELASLEASGDKSEDVAKKIDQLRESLGFLGEQSDVLKTARRTARSSEADKAAEKAEKERQKALEKAQKDQQREADKQANDAIKAQKQLGDKLAEARQNFRDKLKDIGTDLVDKFDDINRKFQDESLEDTIKFNQDEQKEARQHKRELARIERDANDAEKDAIRQRDFAAAAAAREQGAKAISDKQQAENDENTEQQIAFQQDQEARERERTIERREADIDAQRARRDAKIARDRTIRDARATYQDALQIQNSFGTAFVGNFKTMFDNVLQMQSQMNGGSTRTTSTRTTSRTSRTTLTFDDLAYTQP